jgi:hypothetical protein
LAIVALAMLVAPPTRASAQDFAPELEEHIEALARVHALAQRYLSRRQVVVLLSHQGEVAARQRQQIADRVRQQQEGWPEVSEPWSRTIRLGPNGTLDIENLAGDVIITGGRGSEVRIEALRRMRNPSAAQARRLLQQLRIDVEERGGHVEVRTRYPRVRNASGEVTYSIIVPSSANVTVRTMSGNVRVTNIDGELRAEAVSGAVVASDVRRVRLVKTMSGNIELSNGESDELTATTMSGNVLLNNLKGRRFDLQSVTGDVRLRNVQPERAHLRSTNGDIEYVGRIAPSGRYEFQSHAGNIRLTPTNNQGFDIQVGTLGGIFRSDYALRITEDSGAGRRTSSRILRGTFGDAGAAITAHSFGGDIVLVRR